MSLRIADLLQQQLSKIKHLLIVIPHSSISDLPNAEEERARFALVLKKDKKAFAEKVSIFYKVDAVSKKPKAPGTYVHAKTWIFDDELAAIGSANVNERGMSYDSEVIAAVFDKAASKDGDPSFAQRLREALWREHLGLAPESKEVIDATSESSWDLWAKVTKSSKGVSVLKYEDIDLPTPGPKGGAPATMKRVGWDEVEDATLSSVPSVQEGLYNAFADIQDAVNLGRCGI